jgi:DNA-directed RNA polymerase alpha subunit
MSTYNWVTQMSTIQIVSRDESQLAKLRQLGMTSVEEIKLVSMRDYILKLANAISRFV